MAAFEVWAEVQASQGFQEVTSSPTIRRYEGGFETIQEAAARAEEVKKRPEVLSAVIEPGEG